MSSNLVNIQNHINFDLFCKLLQKDISSTQGQGLSIGVVVENDICSTKLLNNIEEVVINKDNHLTLLMHAKRFHDIDDLNLMIFENILIRMLMNSTNQTFNTQIVDVLASLEDLEDIHNEDLQQQLYLLFNDAVYKNVVVFINDLHLCDCDILQELNRLMQFYKKCNVSFVLSMNENMMHATIQDKCESSANPIDGFYNKMFERVYRLPNSIYTHSEEYFDLLMDSSS